MFYRLQLMLNIEDKDTIDDILDKVKDNLDKVVPVPDDTSDFEQAFYLLHQCFHDEPNPKPCLLIDEWKLEI